MMMLLNKPGLSWSYWQWRHRTKGYTERTMSIVSSEGYGQKPLVERELVQKLRGGLNQKRLPAALPVEAEAPAKAPAMMQQMPGPMIRRKPMMQQQRPACWVCGPT